VGKFSCFRVSIANLSIGAAVCKALAEFPLNAIAMHYLKSKEAAQALRTLLRNSHPSLEITLHQADLSQAEECERLASEVLAAHKVVDIFISNAGAARRITDIL
jgi:NAD(P)-dependent dehydrogenase (short-subunit alcohol dehydrogenase family)